jgi:NADH-quinone oxidoreductase subunit C
MNTKEIFEKLKNQFSEDVLRIEVPEEGVPGESSIYVNPGQISDITKFLKEDSELLFDFLSCETAVDLGDKIEVVYILFSYFLRHKVIVKAQIPAERAEIRTVENVWGAANWFEREIFDLFGVLFHGHSNLRRIMLPEDWVGHPLRKNYEDPVEYRQISHKRESSLKKI